MLDIEKTQAMQRVDHLRAQAARDEALIAELQQVAAVAQAALVESEQDRADLRAKLDRVPIGYATTAVTDSKGEATFVLPTGRFDSPPTCQVTVERSTTTPALAPFGYVLSRTASKVVARVVESRTSPVIGAGAAEGLEAAGPGLTVHLYARAAS